MTMLIFQYLCNFCTVHVKLRVHLFRSVNTRRYRTNNRVLVHPYDQACLTNARLGISRCQLSREVVIYGHQEFVFYLNRSPQTGSMVVEHNEQKNQVHFSGYSRTHHCSPLVQAIGWFAKFSHPTQVFDSGRNDQFERSRMTTILVSNIPLSVCFVLS